jgi:predicted amidohydrolase
VSLPTGEVHRESDLITPGNKIVVADTAVGKIGMSICYDLRFAHLYREQAKRGAQILSIPAAFTVPTGQAHWEVLLRARAIETGAFVIAAAQTGEHHGKRKTYGHSMIVSPWGEVLAEGGEDEGLIYAEIDLEAVNAARTAIPALTHDRAIS